jgi:hypothetical protein
LLIARLGHPKCRKRIVSHARSGCIRALMTPRSFVSSDEEMGGLF